MGLVELGLASTIMAHSIIADRCAPHARWDDGLASNESAHPDAVASESLVSSDHPCQEPPAVIHEVRRILTVQGSP